MAVRGRRVAWSRVAGSPVSSVGLNMSPTDLHRDFQRVEVRVRQGPVSGKCGDLLQQRAGRLLTLVFENGQEILRFVSKRISAYSGGRNRDRRNWDPGVSQWAGDRPPPINRVEKESKLSPSANPMCATPAPPT